jgi:hypothetical protein
MTDKLAELFEETPTEQPVRSVRRPRRLQA